MATQVVYDFLKKNQRPYNVHDIIGNLPKDTSKTAVQHALDKLVKGNKVFQKVYGKQKIYCIAQDPKKDVYELMRIDRELQTHATEIEAKRQQIEKDIKTREEILESLKSGPTYDEAIRERDEIKARVEKLDVKLNKLVESSGKLTDSCETKKIAQRRLDVTKREYLKRKRLAINVLDTIMEAFPGTKKQLYDDIGIEEKIVT